MYACCWAVRGAVVALLWCCGEELAIQAIIMRASLGAASDSCQHNKFVCLRTRAQAQATSADSLCVYAAVRRSTPMVELLLWATPWAALAPA